MAEDLARAPDNARALAPVVLRHGDYAAAAAIAEKFSASTAEIGDISGNTAALAVAMIVRQFAERSPAPQTAILMVSAVAVGLKVRKLDG